MTFLNLFTQQYQAIVAAWAYNYDLVVLGVYYTSFRTRPVGTGLRGKFGRKVVEQQGLVASLVQVRSAFCALRRWQLRFCFARHDDHHIFGVDSDWSTVPMHHSRHGVAGHHIAAVAGDRGFYAAAVRFRGLRPRLHLFSFRSGCERAHFQLVPLGVLVDQARHRREEVQLR